MAEIDRMISELEQARSDLTNGIGILEHDLAGQKAQLSRVDAMLKAANPTPRKPRAARGPARKRKSNHGKAQTKTVDKVLDVIRSGKTGPPPMADLAEFNFTTNQLAAAAHVAPSTVQRVIRVLADDNVIRHAGAVPTKGPHPAQVYAVVGSRNSDSPGHIPVRSRNGEG